jgi:hypothetical protein
MAEIDIEARTDAPSRIGQVIGTALACILVIALVLAYLGVRI